MSTTPTLHPAPTTDQRPPASETRLPALCPQCGEELASASEYVRGRGFLVLYLCSACDYRRVL